MKRCLIISDGPVPTPEHKKVEGGGLRCWGLARGLKTNRADLDVTVAYHEEHKDSKKFTSSYKDINIVTWNHEKLGILMGKFDTIIVSYCMGDLSVQVADKIRADQQLILDCYVPIYIEVSARQSKDIDSEYSAFHHDVPRWAHVLRKGDLFLCANESQKKFYEGVLASLGRINPVTYGEDLIRIVPYGIYRDKPVQKSHPIQKLIGPDQEKYKKVLWFGGIYPWFNLEDLIDAVSKINKQIPTKLIIVGAKNPFNNHPDFVRKYDELIDYIRNNKLQDMVIIQDWVSFESRADWYLDSDVVVVINKIGQENSLAWRTRLVDFTWANLPIITNGGDPLSNLLVDADAVALFKSLSPTQMADDILSLIRNEKKMETIKTNLLKVREGLYWDVVTRELAISIISSQKPADFSKYGSYEHITNTSGANSITKKVIRKIRKIPAYTRKYGIKNTYTTAVSVIGRKARSYFSPRWSKAPRIIIFSHQLDMSGAPFIIMDFAIELKKSYPDLPIEFYTFNPAHNSNIVFLNRHGIRPKILFDKDSVINFNKGDVVVLNTVAQSQSLKGEVFRGLENNTISKLFWYVHEDEPELIFEKAEARRISQLIQDNKIEILAAAIKTLDHYKEFFKNEKSIKAQPYKVIISHKYHRQLKSRDFTKKISFILPGTVGDGRKGQLPIFYAFADFLDDYYKRNPLLYRDFELVYVGLTEDFPSRQILQHAKKALGNHFVFYGRLTREECLEVILKSNATICYSLRECLPLFVFEGMIAGHPILRNDSSGMEEQLVDGKNGYLLDSSDFQGIKHVIEKMLNKEKTSDEELASMSLESYGIALSQEKNNYSAATKRIKDSFVKRKIPKSKN